MGALSDKWIPPAILLACIALFMVTLNFEEVPEGLSQNIPPERFPQLILLVMAGFAFALMLQSGQPTRGKRPPLSGSFYATSALLLLFMLAHEWLGTMVSMFLLLLVFPWLWGERRFLLILIYALMLPAAIYGLFVKVLQVQFPWGIFEFVR